MLKGKDISPPNAFEMWLSFPNNFNIYLIQERSKKHFEEEEKNLLPLMEAAEMSKAQQDKVLDQCLDVMHGTHSHLFRFFMEGLLPPDAMHYLDMLSRCSDQNRVSSMLRLIVDKVV